jgi:hypothetical protein
MNESEYDLTVSKKSVGALCPILKDTFGNIIDTVTTLLRNMM